MDFARLSAALGKGKDSLTFKQATDVAEALLPDLSLGYDEKIQDCLIEAFVCDSHIIADMLPPEALYTHAMTVMQQDPVKKLQYKLEAGLKACAEEDSYHKVEFIGRSGLQWREAELLLRRLAPLVEARAIGAPKYNPADSALLTLQQYRDNFGGKVLDAPTLCTLAGNMKETLTFN